MNHIDTFKGAAVLPHPGGTFLTTVKAHEKIHHPAISGVLVRTNIT